MRRISQHRRNQVRYRPTTNLACRETIINSIIEQLYRPHWNYWHKNLGTIIQENKDYHGRKGNKEDFGIYYAGKAWFIPKLIRTGEGPLGSETASEFNILPMHNKYPDMEKRLIKVTSNIAELDVETYEVNRFLAGLLLFPAPLELLETILGPSLYSHIGQCLEELTEDLKQHIWNDHTEIALQTYAKEHDYLIDAMCQRVMMSLIIGDAFRDVANA